MRTLDRDGARPGRAAPAIQSRSNPGSGARLRKTGIFAVAARDFRRMGLPFREIGSLETERQIAKARHWRAFLLLLGASSPTSGVAGWRRSADRTRLRADSLLTGNLTGKIAILGAREP